MKRETDKKKLIGIAAAIAVALVIVVAITLIFFNLKPKEEPEPVSALDAVVESVNETEADAADATEETEDTDSDKPYIPTKNLNWDELHDVNPDIYAWICVPDAENVDFPILQHKSDDLYYLEHNIDGSAGLPGVIYTEPTYTSKDFSDHLTVVYGHHMKDGSMFGHLVDLADIDLDEDHFIYIYTPKKNFIYRIYAVYEYPAVHLLANSDMTNEYIFEDYLNTVQDTGFEGHPSNWSTTVKPTINDKVITLSTCVTGGDENYRFLVQGLLTDEVDP